LVLLSAGFAFSPTPGSTAIAQSGDCNQQCQEELSQARAATALYHQDSKALEGGFIPDHECVQAPGAGGMGFHYFNLARMNDTSVDPASPELLLYEPQADGSRKLVGVEYFAPVIVNGSPWFGEGPPPNGQYNAAPVLFGRAFNGPMPGHNPYMPWHYDLHVWIWRNNPAGMFALFNPKVICQ
jgi:hypothetical protein